MSNSNKWRVELNTELNSSGERYVTEIEFKNNDIIIIFNFKNQQNNNVQRIEDILRPLFYK